MKVVRIISLALIAWGVMRFVFAYGIYNGAPSAYNFWSLVLIVLGVALPKLNFVNKFLAGNSNRAKQSDDNEVSMSNQRDYFHEYGGTSVSLNKADMTLTLQDGKNSKIYPFSHVRTWERKIQKGGAVYGTGLAVVVGNIAAGADNQKNTGLFIHVKDIDFPVWHIKFRNGKKLDKELASWMEILRQTINND